ncbi:MAG: hypothetical protein V4475_04385 [Pseudomonadota bacterium]|jgi:hypothetical protein
MADTTKHLSTMSIEQRKVIGQAIIDGVLSPRQVSLIDTVSDYAQASGNYTQRGGGNYVQGGGNYNQAPKEAFNFGEQLATLGQIAAVGKTVGGR